MNKYLILSVTAFMALPFIALAQSASTSPTTAPMMSANLFELTPSPDSEQLDYHLLYNNTFNQVDLDQAKSDHLSDRQLAKIYKLAEEGGCQFRDVYAQVKDGYTFRILAERYGVSLRSLNDVQRQQDDIDAYESANAATGLGNAPRPNRVESSIDSIKQGHH